MKMNQWKLDNDALSIFCVKNEWNLMRDDEKDLTWMGAVR